MATFVCLFVCLFVVVVVVSVVSQGALRLLGAATAAPFFSPLSRRCSVRAAFEGPPPAAPTLPPRIVRAPRSSCQVMQVAGPTVPMLHCQQRGKVQVAKRHCASAVLWRPSL